MTCPPEPLVFVSIKADYQSVADSAPDPVLANIVLLALDGLTLSETLHISHVRKDQYARIGQCLAALTQEMYA